MPLAVFRRNSYCRLFVELIDCRQYPRTTAARIPPPDVARASPACRLIRRFHARRMSTAHPRSATCRGSSYPRTEAPRPSEQPDLRRQKCIRRPACSERSCCSDPRRPRERLGSYPSPPSKTRAVRRSKRTETATHLWSVRFFICETVSVPALQTKDPPPRGTSPNQLFGQELNSCNARWNRQEHHSCPNAVGGGSCRESLEPSTFQYSRIHRTDKSRNDLRPYGRTCLPPIEQRGSLG